MRSLRMHLGSNYAIEKVFRKNKSNNLMFQIFAKELLEEPWEENTEMLVFPGGRDLPYVHKLKGTGNQRIREYVENGGNSSI